jgi:hypothetical protein
MMAKGTRTKVGRKTREGSVDDSFVLAEEVRTYETHLPGWVDREGQFVLIKDRDVLGFYPRYEQAMEAGYKRIADGPFLVKQIAQYEPIYNLGNVVL